MNQTLEAMARAIFKSWFIDFDPVHTKAQGHTPPGLDPTIAALFPDSFHDSPLGLIPTGWRVSTVGDEFQLTMGQSPPGSTYNEAGAGIPFFQGRADFGFRYPTNRVYCTAPTRFADKHDTLVSVRAPVGDINLAAGRCAVGRGVAAVRHNGGSRSYTYHGMHTLSDHFARYEGEGTVFGSINRKGFTSIAWLAPEDGIIDAFEQTVHPIDEQVEVNIRQSMTLATLRDALLPKLLCGELRVRQIQGCTEGAIL
jgi:type I restriction enzyme S subunit